MPSQPTIPPFLSPYLSPLPSLTLLTSTLGATSNWLLLRFVAAALKKQGLSVSDGATEAGQTGGEMKVVLVSWLREAAFWRDGCRRLVRADPNRHSGVQLNGKEM